METLKYDLGLRQGIEATSGKLTVSSGIKAPISRMKTIMRILSGHHSAEVRTLEVWSNKGFIHSEVKQSSTGRDVRAENGEIRIPLAFMLSRSVQFATDNTPLII